MLVQLTISDFAIIRHLDLALRPGLNIISGETGAGKSILIQAVNLVLGGRASGDLIRSGASEARVEALFSLPDRAALGDVLAEWDIPFEGELVIKRTLSREGRNRVQVNGTLATLQTLSRMADRLISISGQHEHQRLLRPENHLPILDAFGGLEEERFSLSAVFETVRSLRAEKARLETEIRADEERQELLRFQVREIEETHIRPDEDLTLAEERKRLQFAGELQEIIRYTYQRLYESEESVVSVLSQCVKRLEKGAGIERQVEDVRAGIDEIRLKAEDAALTLRELERSVKGNPERLQEVEERIALLHRLKRKYGPTLGDVLTFREKAACLLTGREEKKERLSALGRELEAAAGDLYRKAEALSRKRMAAARKLEASVIRELQDLHMAGTAFQVRFYDGEESSKPPGEDGEGIGPDGMDRAEFVIAPNVGEELRPLAKIASGGELSRIMLALKTILARGAGVETVIFDEVDAGISGATAEMIGEKLLALSRFHQVVCITHLPQIACKGPHHFLVKKGVSGGRTEAVISELDSDSRVHEIARLLGGLEITAAAVARAREMIRGRPRRAAPD